MFKTIDTTKQDIIRDTINGISTGSDHDLLNFIRWHEHKFNMVWFPTGCTTQDILDAYGTEAVQLFIKSQMTQEFIKSMKPDYVPLVPPKPFVINPDWTVTITEENPE